MYDIILNNLEYLKIVEKIEKKKFISNGKWDWEHGFGHYKRVAGYVETILKQLNESNRTIELGKCAALLHDIGLSECENLKKDHALKSSLLFRNFLKDTNINLEEEKILEDAIKDHSNGNNINSIVGLALLLGDKLDVTYHRTINSSIQDKVNKEFQKIKKVDVIIDNDNLIVNYIATGNLDLNIIKEWDKAISIPQKAANYLNRKFVFMINSKLVSI